MVRKGRYLLAILVSMVLVVSCSVRPGAPGTSEGPSASPSAEPSPTPDPAAKLLDQLADRPFTARADVEGTMTFAETPFEVRGTAQIGGGDLTSELTLTGGEASSTLERAVVDERVYERKDDGVWLERVDLKGTRAAVGPGSLLRGIDVATNDGPTTYHGDRLFAVKSRDIDAFEMLEALGYLDPGSKDVRGTITLVVDLDGLLRGWLIEATLTQTTGDVSAHVVVDLDYTLSKVGAAASIEAPEDLWVRFTSTAGGYSIAHPADWDVSSDEGVDWFVAPRATEVGVMYVAFTEGPPLLNDWVRGTLTIFEDEYSATVDGNDPLTVGGYKGRLVYGHGTIEGEERYIVDAVFMTDLFGYDLCLYSEPGDEAVDRDVLLDFVRTFELAD